MKRARSDKVGLSLIVYLSTVACVNGNSTNVMLSLGKHETITEMFAYVLEILGENESGKK